MLTIDTIPLFNLRFWMGDFGFAIPSFKSEIRNPNSEIELFILFVRRVAAATSAELFELKPVRRGLFILRRYVIPLFALRALQNYVISRHITSRSSQLFVVRVLLFNYPRTTINDLIPIQQLRKRFLLQRFGRPHG